MWFQTLDSLGGGNLTLEDYNKLVVGDFHLVQEGGVNRYVNHVAQALGMGWLYATFTLSNQVLRVGSTTPVNINTVTTSPEIHLVWSKVLHDGLILEDVLRRSIPAPILGFGYGEMGGTITVPKPDIQKVIEKAIKEGIVPSNSDIVIDSTGAVTVDGICINELAKILGIIIGDIANPPTDLTGIIELLQQILGRQLTQEELERIQAALDVQTGALWDILSKITEQAQVQTDILAEVRVLTQTAQAPPNGGFVDPNIPFFQDRFPFSLPQDFVNLLGLIKEDEKVPIFKYDFKLKNELLGIDIDREIVIDPTMFRTENGTDIFRAFVRFAIIVLFAVGLIRLSIKLVGLVSL
jgi:hypothetical protein